MARTYRLHRPAASGAPRIDYAEELNPQQCEAVTAPPGPSLVIAGAGSGKTRTLTYRVAYLLENGRASRSRSCCSPSRTRPRARCSTASPTCCPTATQGIWGGTFHSIGQPHPPAPRRRRRLSHRLHHHGSRGSGGPAQDRAGRLGHRPQGQALSQGARCWATSSASRSTPRAASRRCSRRAIEYFLPLTAEITGLAHQYELKKKAVNSLDFDDLLDKCAETPPPGRRRRGPLSAAVPVRSRRRVPGHQPAAGRVHRPARRASSQRHGGGRRRAVDLLVARREFRKHPRFPEAISRRALYKIETNYRSTPEILALANAAIAANDAAIRKGTPRLAAGRRAEAGRWCR